jgi:hypothetical protein
MTTNKVLPLIILLIGVIFFAYIIGNKGNKYPDFFKLQLDETFFSWYQNSKRATFHSFQIVDSNGTQVQLTAHKVGNEPLVHIQCELLDKYGFRSGIGGDLYPLSRKKERAGEVCLLLNKEEMSGELFFRSAALK